MKFTPKKARLTMEERNMDVQEGRRLRSVRRRLFQSDDEGNRQETGQNSGVDDNLANQLFEEARKSREDAKERWNFDFEKEEPLPGRYEWVKLDQDGNEITHREKSDNEANTDSEVTGNHENRENQEIRIDKENTESQ